MKRVSLNVCPACAMGLVLYRQIGGGTLKPGRTQSILCGKPSCRARIAGTAVPVYHQTPAKSMILSRLSVVHARAVRVAVSI